MKKAAHAMVEKYYAKYEFDVQINKRMEEEIPSPGVKPIQEEFGLLGPGACTIGEYSGVMTRDVEHLETCTATCASDELSEKTPISDTESNHTARPTAGIPSRGSKNHADGRCRPCRFQFTPQGCPDGARCNFCHYEHSQAKLMNAQAWSLRRAVVAKGQRRRVSDTSGSPCLAPRGCLDSCDYAKHCNDASHKCFVACEDSDEMWTESDISDSASSPLPDWNLPEHVSGALARVSGKSGSPELLRSGGNLHGHTGSGISAKSDIPSPPHSELDGMLFERQSRDESITSFGTIASPQVFAYYGLPSEQCVAPNGGNIMAHPETVLMQHMVFASMTQAGYSMNVKTQRWATFIMECTPQDLFSLVVESQRDLYLE